MSDQQHAGVPAQISGKTTAQAPEWIEELKTRLKGEVAVDEKTLEEFSTDASIFKVKPQVVVFPKDEEDVKTLVRFVNEKRAEHPDLSLTGRAAGTDMTGGSISDSIIVSFAKHFGEFELVNHEACVQPGVYYRDLESAMDARGLMLPSYPASKSIAALGGMIMNNSAGEKTLRYGKTDRYVRELRVVLKDGKEYVLKPLSRDELELKKAQQDFEGDLYRRIHELIEQNHDALQAARPDVTKNSAGYALWDVWDKETDTFDLTKLFVGSQGTLGLMLEARLGLVEVKPHTRLAVLFLDSLGPLPDLVNALLPLEPEALETFDDHTLALALRFFPGIARKVPGENLLTLAWKFLPEFWIGVQMMGLPKLVVLCSFAEETEEEVEEKVQQFHKRAQTFGVHHRIMHTSEDAEKYFVIRRESFNLLREHVSGKRTAPFVDDIVVKPEHLPEVLPKVYEILEKYGITTTLAGHAGSGNMHLIPLMDLSKEEERQKIPAVSQEVFELVLQYGGSITAEHNDGLVRGPYLRQMYGGDVYQLFREVKYLFDPDGIFNPGKKVDVNYDWAMEHIDPKR